MDETDGVPEASFRVVGRGVHAFVNDEPNPYSVCEDVVDDSGVGCDSLRRRELAVRIRQVAAEMDLSNPDTAELDTDGTLWEWCDSADDPVVRYVARELAFISHLDWLEKPTWDLLQRLCLLCESRHSIEWKKRRASSRVWPFGLVSLVVQVLVLANYGLWPFLSCGFVLNLIGLTIWVRLNRRKSQVAKQNRENALVPFTSIADVKFVCVETGFRKQRYPRKSQKVEETGYRMTPAMLVFLFSLVPGIPTLVMLAPTAQPRATVVVCR